jgi:hypothetical protein
MPKRANDVIYGLLVNTAKYLPEIITVGYALNNRMKVWRTVKNNSSQKA